MIKRSGQASLEYLIIIGIAIAVFAIITSYSLTYFTGASLSASSSNLNLAAEDIISAANSVSTQQAGSVVDFTLHSPGIIPGQTFFCNNLMYVTSQNARSIQSTILPITGILPISAGV